MVMFPVGKKPDATTVTVAVALLVRSATLVPTTWKVPCPAGGSFRQLRLTLGQQFL